MQHTRVSHNEWLVPRGYATGRHGSRADSPFMNTTLTLVAIVVFSFVVGRVFSRYASRLLAFTGVEYLLAGVLLGPHVPPRVLSQDVLDSLELLLSMVLGILGFTIGLALRRIRHGMEIGLAGVASALGVALLVGAASLLAFQVGFPGFLEVEAPLAQIPLAYEFDRLWSVWIAADALWMALTIGAAAAVASPTLIRLAGSALSARPERIELLGGLATAAQATAVVVFGLAMAGTRTEDVSGQLTLTEWGLVTVAAGTICGLLFSVFIGREDDAMRINVATVGAVTFASGIGAALGVSPLLVNLVAGAIVSATSPSAERLEATLGPLLTPANVLVLLIGGAMWQPVSGWLWLLPLGYAALRILARRSMSRIAVWTFVPESGLAVGVGRGLLSHGALACAIAVSFSQRFPAYAGAVLTTVIGGMLLTDFFSVRVLRTYLADMGDLPAVPETPAKVSPPPQEATAP